MSIKRFADIKRCKFFKINTVVLTSHYATCLLHYERRFLQSFFISCLPVPQNEYIPLSQILFCVVLDPRKSGRANSACIKKPCHRSGGKIVNPHTNTDMKYFKKIKLDKFCTFVVKRFFKDYLLYVVGCKYMLEIKKDI